MLNVIAGNETGQGGILGAFPTDNFNGMTIGASAKSIDGFYREVADFNIFNLDAVGPRTSIDLIAPGKDIEMIGPGNNVVTRSGTSFASPHVTGTVALLQKHANNSGWIVNARRHEVMKAVLMNSADKLKDNGDGNLLGMTRTVLDSNGNDWLASEAANNALIPVDDEFGAGHLNADRAFTQFQSGEQDAAGADVSVIGWDYGTPTTIFGDYRYAIGEPLRQGSRLAVTLTWDRIVEFDINDGDMNENGRYDQGDTFEPYNTLDEVVNDLDLLIVPRGDDGTNSVAVSIGDIQDGGYNLEHLFSEIPTTGLYDIIVRHFDNSVGIPLGLQNYGIAWWGVSDAPLSGDFDADGDVDGADFLVWQRNTSVGNLSDWQSNYGNSASLATATAVPEPSTCLLLSVGFLLACQLSRSKDQRS